MQWDIYLSASGGLYLILNVWNMLELINQEEISPNKSVTGAQCGISMLCG